MPKGLDKSDVIEEIGRCWVWDTVTLVSIEDRLKQAYLETMQQVSNLKCDTIKKQYEQAIADALSAFWQISRNVKPITLPFKALLRNFKLQIKNIKREHIPDPKKFKSLWNEEKLKIYNDLFIRYQEILLEVIENIDHCGICIEINWEFKIVSEVVKWKDNSRAWEGNHIIWRIIKWNAIKQIKQAKSKLKDNEIVYICPTKTVTNEVDAIVLFRKLNAYLLLESYNHENDLSIAQVQLICKKFSEEIDSSLNEYLNLYTQKQLNDTQIMLEEQKHDSLTWFLSRKAFDERIESIVTMAPRTSKWSSVVCLFDLDHFKKVNDTYWHNKWDEVLTTTAEIMRRKFQRQTDICARRWWEEIVVVLQDTTIDTAEKMCEEIRKELEETFFSSELGEFWVTLTVWISDITWEKLSNMSDKDSLNQFKEIVHQADRCLYNWKRSWRNQVVVYDKIHLPLDC